MNEIIKANKLSKHFSLGSQTVSILHEIDLLWKKVNLYLLWDLPAAVNAPFFIY